MEPPDGCPPEVYDIMRQVNIRNIFFTYIMYLMRFTIYGALLNHCYYLIGMGFATRKETKFSRYKSDAWPVESRVHQRCELRRNLTCFKGT